MWILGSNGLLGGALINRCKSEGVPYIASKKTDVNITDLEALHRGAEAGKCTHLINCAAYTDVDGAEKNPRAAFAVNAHGAENIAIVAREHGIHPIHVSTDYVFDGEKPEPYVETDKPNPLGVYGKSKLEGEERLLDQFPNACVVRTSWIFGREGKNFISTLLAKLMSQEAILAVEDQINKPTYDRDLASALLDLASHRGIFHFANGGPLSRYEIAKDFFEEVLARSIPVKCQRISPILSDAFPALCPRPRASVLDTEKVSRALGRKPRMWKTVLQEYFDHALPRK